MSVKRRKIFKIQNDNDRQMLITKGIKEEEECLICSFLIIHIIILMNDE